MPKGLGVQVPSLADFSRGEKSEQSKIENRAIDKYLRRLRSIVQFSIFKFWQRLERNFAPLVKPRWLPSGRQQNSPAPGESETSPGSGEDSQRTKSSPSQIPIKSGSEQSSKGKLKIDQRVWFLVDNWEPTTDNCILSGSSSVVECYLAKVDVAGSNPVSRSFFRRAKK